jgi:hypothetical protein
MTTTHDHPRRRTPARRRAGRAVTLVAAIAMLGGTTTSASAEPQGHVREELGLGYFYGTFDQDPNITVLAGGRAEEFCDDNPDDPFNAEPGTVAGRLYPRGDGSLDIRATSPSEPFHLYEQTVGEAPEWIEAVCATYVADGTIPEPFASGTGHLKIRVTVDGNVVDVFNSITGIATSPESAYHVRAWADVIVVDGVPQGNPADFVGTEIVEIRR